MDRLVQELNVAWNELLEKMNQINIVWAFLLMVLQIFLYSFYFPIIHIRSLNRPNNFKDKQKERFIEINNLLEEPSGQLGPNAEPSRFLREEFQIVDFHGRKKELESLTDWVCPKTLPDKNVSIALVTGSQGRGKSRLARELCKRVRKGENGETWSAGFLKMEVEEDDLPRPMEWQRPMLLVIDQAERRVEQVKKIVSAAFERQGDHPVRILLIARSKDKEWWSSRSEGLKEWSCLKRSANESGKERIWPFARDKIREVELASIEDDKELRDRRQEFNRALKAFKKDKVFKEFLEQSKTGSADEISQNNILNDLLRAEKVDLLDIHIAALLTARGGGADQLEDLFEGLKNWEAEGWYEEIKKASLEQRLKPKQIRLAFAWLATTDGLTDEDDAVARLRLLPDFDKRSQADCDNIVEIAEKLYPSGSPKWWGGIAPDRLATWLTKELDIIIEQEPKTVAGLPEDALINLLRHLTWRTQFYWDKDEQVEKNEQGNEDKKVLENAIRAGDGQGIIAVVEVGRETGDLIGKIASKVLREMAAAKHSEVIEVARKVEDSIDLEAISLREFAHAAAEILYRNAPRNKDKEERAKWAHRLSIRLSMIGDIDGAIEKGEEAVSLRRELAKALPGAFRSDLAQSLHNLSIDLSDSGRRERREEALATIEEAAGIRRELAEVRPDEFRPDLAGSLNSLSARLSSLGRSEEAFMAIKEAKKIYRELDKTEPEKYRSRLAMSLHTWSDCLSDRGQRKKALEAIEEAEKIYRELAKSQPDSFRRGWATSLHTLSNCLSALGKRQKAFKAIEEAVAIRRELAKTRPDVFHPDLARSLNRLSNRLSDLGERKEALEVIEEAVVIFRGLPAARLKKFCLDWARSLNDLGNCQFACGKREEAFEAVEEAVAIRRELAEDLPKKFRPDLAQSLNDQSVFLSALGEHEKGLKVIEEAVDIHYQLAEDLSDAFRPELAKSLNNLSARLFDLGRRPEACAASEKSVAIFRELEEDLPDAFRPYLAMSLNSLGRCRSALGKHEGALEAIEEAAILYRELEEDLPEKFRPDLARNLHDLSACRSALGKRKEALEASEEAVAIFRELEEDLPDKFRPDLARSLNHLNDDLGARDQRGFDAIKESVRIYRELAQIRPNVFHPSLADSLYNLSMSWHAREEHEQALKAIEEAVGIHRELAKSKPDKFRPALARGLIHLSACLSSASGKRDKEALAALKEAVRICYGLMAKLPDVYGPDLAVSLRSLSNFLSDRGDHDEAFAAIEEAVARYRKLAAARPSMFRPYLIGSLHDFGKCLSACGRRLEALAANEEARRLDLENRFEGWGFGAVKMFLRVRRSRPPPTKRRA